MWYRTAILNLILVKLSTKKVGNLLVDIQVVRLFGTDGVLLNRILIAIVVVGFHLDANAPASRLTDFGRLQFSCHLGRIILTRWWSDGNDRPPPNNGMMTVKICNKFRGHSTDTPVPHEGGHRRRCWCFHSQRSWATDCARDAWKTQKPLPARCSRQSVSHFFFHENIFFPLLKIGKENACYSFVNTGIEDQYESPSRSGGLGYKKVFIFITPFCSFTANGRENAPPICGWI